MEKEIIIFMLKETMFPFILFLILGLIAFRIIYSKEIKEMDN